MAFSAASRIVPALLLSLALGCEAGPPSPAASGTAEQGATASAPRRVVATGRVEGWREADVGSKMRGSIRSFEAELAERVERGVAVVRLDDRELRGRLRGAEARAGEARRELERRRALDARGILSAAELERAEWTWRTRSAELEEARALLAHATLRAPFTGTLIWRYKEVGESVHVGGGPDPVFRIADLSRLKVTAEVPETDIGTVRPGQFAIVTTSAHPAARFPGRVHRVGLAVGRKRLRSDDPRQRLFEKVVEVELELVAEPRLRSGMTVDVEFYPE